MSKHVNVDLDLLRRRFLEGLTNKQIAERTGINPSTISHARQRIFRQMREEQARAEVFDSPLVRRQAT